MKKTPGTKKTEKPRKKRTKETAEELQPLEEEQDTCADSGEKSDPEVRPLIVCDENGGFLFFASTSRKGYTKSIEQESLWAIHPDTDKLLPIGKESKLKTIQDRTDYYYAEVTVTGTMLEDKPDETEKAAAAEGASVQTEAAAQPDILNELTALIARRKQEKTEGSYTTYLFQAGNEKIRKKTGEEAVELILAREKDEIIYEAADLIYHMLVFLEAEEIPLALVLNELKSRR
ncbi:MAG: phosphoribosyl-ATP diphosphatase [Spirochaetales bacterium]|jgi:phosphoribosyl-ATP pyrophosphohydrolase|nr:phosphoribosyl-ATP diphosphatase [Spirochaetales bacterium]